MSQRSIIIKQLAALETDLPDSPPPPPPSCAVNNICAVDKHHFYFSSCNAGNDDKKTFSVDPCKPEHLMSDSLSFCFFFVFFFFFPNRKTILADCTAGGSENGNETA